MLGILIYGVYRTLCVSVDGWFLVTHGLKTPREGRTQQ
jgi:hypothetical protein